ncbi:MAG: P-II family nitrogen regulator [Rectinemataceae bacterium]
MSRKISAVIKKAALDDVLQALRKIGISDVSAEKHGLRETNLEFHLNEWRLETVVQTIISAASSGSRFDGVIAIYPEVFGGHLREDTRRASLSREQDEMPVAVGE